MLPQQVSDSCNSSTDSNNNSNTTNTNTTATNNNGASSSSEARADTAGQPASHQDASETPATRGQRDPLLALRVKLLKAARRYEAARMRVLRGLRGEAKEQFLKDFPPW